MTVCQIFAGRRRVARALAALLLALGLAVPAWPAAPKKTASKAGARKTASKKAGVRKTGRRRATTAASARSRAKTRRATTQQAPTPERYREIQQALTARGYNGGEADGAWGPQWADALKRFQKDQKIEASGKVNSLSLIALGLGAKRDSGATAPPAPASESPKRELP